MGSGEDLRRIEEIEPSRCQCPEALLFIEFDFYGRFLIAMSMSEPPVPAELPVCEYM